MYAHSPTPQLKPTTVITITSPSVTSAATTTEAPEAERAPSCYQLPYVTSYMRTQNTHVSLDSRRHATADRTSYSRKIKDETRTLSQYS